MFEWYNIIENTVRNKPPKILSNKTLASIRKQTHTIKYILNCLAKPTLQFSELIWLQQAAKYIID